MSAQGGKIEKGEGRNRVVKPVGVEHRHRKKPVDQTGKYGSLGSSKPRRDVQEAGESRNRREPDNESLKPCLLRNGYDVTA